ncbi:hypothetical protein R2B67_33635 [Streptomyces cyaneofuscatus]|uniref:hypothetical protein n=1 Tax=Streptomyces cyaneofuscatus TaxID=66883 RepID=UPI0029530535|nr:hypothetical protein [Streptomyces cyaneofuscatus]WOP13191.1 hypothetical protein R2B67_33635 [Streptomyces cyaneofuscatus]
MKGTATAEFHRELANLYRAANSPTYKSLVRLAHDQRPPLRASTTSVSSWLTGATVPAPASRKVYLLLVSHLQKRAVSESRTYQPRAERYWSTLLDNARREKDSRRGGRPRSEPAADTLPDPRRDAALDSYLAWVIDVTRRMPVQGLHAASGLVELELERVYVALKVDTSSPRERAAAVEALRQELDARLGNLDLPPEEVERRRWYLYSDLPAADYLGTADRLSELLVEPTTILTVDELYRREAAAVILGDPGSGKTTVMRWLALVHATALRNRETRVRVASTRVDTTRLTDEEVVLGRPLIPVLVRVGEYAADRQHRAAQGLPPRGLTEFLGHHTWNGQRPVWLADSGDYRANEQLPQEVVADLLTTALRRGQALVVLDGLDEVAAEVREETAAAVSEFVRAWTGDGRVPEEKGNRTFVTSRIAGYHLAPLPLHLPQVTVERMTGQALKVFVKSWIAEIAGAVREPLSPLTDPVAAADSLLTLLAAPANRHARDLASNPLLASVIVSVFLNGGGSLPPQRVELFDEAAGALMQAWKRRLGGGFSSTAYQSMLATLPAVATYIHATKPNGVITWAEFRAKVLREMARIDRTDPEHPNPLLQARVDSLLETMRTEVGLLVESGPDAFRFSHQTFQEFFAARHLVAEPACRLERLTARLADPRWREPILMGLALVNWESADLVVVVRELLAVDGRLSEFFPDTGLLLAAAVLQMTDVPADAVRAIVTTLVAGYGSAMGRQRLSRTRELINTSIAALREDGYAEAVDEALVEALAERAESRLPGAAAAIVAGVGAVSSRLAEALAAAADRDDPDLGHPITAALGGMVPTGASHQPGRLPADWRSGRLKMRDLLRRSPEEAQRVAADPLWQSLVLCLYGGQPDLGAASALDEYHRIANFLQQSDFRRSGFTDYFGEMWSSDDPIYTMAVHLDTHGHKRRWSQQPRFVVEAIWRDTRLTRWIQSALQRDDLPGLTDFLAGRQYSTDPREAADATLALWALGHEQDEFLSNGTPAALLASVRISALAVQLRDATVRAAPAAVRALVEAADRLPTAEWDELRQVVTSTLIEAGAPPIEFPDPALLPDHAQISVLADEITQHVLGYGDDSLYNAVEFADRIDGHRFPADRLVAALHGRGANRVDGYPLFQYWWPADPLCFTDDDDPVPSAVLDQILRLPAPLSFSPGWLFRDVLAPLIADHPVLPEALAVAWSSTRRRGGDAAGTLSSFDAELAVTADAYGHLRRLADDVADPWYQARAWLRLAELFPARRPALLALVRSAIAEVSEGNRGTVRAFQLAERVALLTTTAERASALDECRRRAEAIAEDHDAATALLRLARFLPSPDCDPVALKAIDRAARSDDQIGRTLLARAMAEFEDRPAVRTAVERAAGGAAAVGPDSILGRRLPALIGADPHAAQVWTPVALHARAREVGRRRRTAEAEAAWARLAASPDTEAVAAVLAVHDYGLIECRAPVVRAVTAAAEARGVDLDPVLSRLVRLDCAAEPLVTGWLAHGRPRLRQSAALLLTEYHRLNATTVGPITELLTDDDDLLRGRALDVLDREAERKTTHDSVARLEPTTLEHLAKFAIAQRGYEPSGALVITWHLSSVLQDDPAAFRRWCAAVDAGGPDADVAACLLEHLLPTDDRVFDELLTQLSAASPPLLAVLVKSCLKSIHTDARNEDGATLEYDSQRWARLYATLSALDVDRLRQQRFLVAHPGDVVAAIHSALKETGGALDEQSVDRASAALWQSCGTDLGTSLTDAVDPAAAHAQLARIGAQFFYAEKTIQEVLAAYRELNTSASDEHWPWADLLVRWVCRLLDESVVDEPGRWERSHALVALQAVAVTDADILRQLPEAEELGQHLADALMYHNSFPGRAAAAELLGVLRAGSSPTLRALESGLRDVTAVRSAALRAYGALRLVDEDLVDDLATALTGPSSVTAWAAARLLSIIGERASTPARVRDRIIDLLADTARDPRSRRTVYFSYMATPIPLLPELDDAVVEALQRVFRIE